MTKMISLHGRNGKDKFALVDDDMFDELNRYNWYCSQGYASRSQRRDGKRLTIHMHWHILRLQPGFVIDHINGNRLDNRRCNLRICTRADNNKNKIGPVKPTSSIYKGVCWRPHTNAWKAYIKTDGKQKHLGYFEHEEDAALAYDIAAKKQFGEFARLNFPDKLNVRIQKRNQNRGETRPNAKLTTRQVLEIKAIYARGETSQSKLAECYGVSRGAIDNIIRGITWKHIDMVTGNDQR